MDVWGGREYQSKFSFLDFDGIRVERERRGVVVCIQEVC